MLSASLDFLPGCIHVIVGVLVKKHHIWTRYSIKIAIKAFSVFSVRPQKLDMCLQNYSCFLLEFSASCERFIKRSVSSSVVIFSLLHKWSFAPVSVDPNDQKKTACYDIDVEVEDPLKSQMSSFLLSTANQQEIASLDNKVRATTTQSANCGLILPRLWCCKSRRGDV